MPQEKNIYLKAVTLVTFIAFTLIERANFRLDPDNIGLFAGFAIIAFGYNAFGSKFIKLIQKVDFNSLVQSPQEAGRVSNF